MSRAPEPPGDRYYAAADEELRAAHDPPLELAEYVERAFEQPDIAAHAAKYLLAAIEHAGTRTVIEGGAERERYRFFDDPHNDGEHAVLGNTDVLNDFVEDLRAIAAGRAKDEKIVWFSGPTATGKSELKRCLVNGLREYSKTEAGRRYTVEWNATTGGDERGLSYGTVSDDRNWRPSPVQTHPLSVFPEGVREDLVADINADSDGLPIRVDRDLDPFSAATVDDLLAHYREAGEDAPFSAIASDDHCRVQNYVVDIGQGIGVLHAEDDGTPRERLVGTWLPELLGELDSRGRKHPHAFSYDGALAQGNGLLTVVEDATQHADLLQKLLNVVDEGMVKLDKGVTMDVDTQLVVISNPDLEATLDRHADSEAQDPLKALKRRLVRHEVRYLTSLSREAELIHREVTGDTRVWTGAPEQRLDRAAESVHVEVLAGRDRRETRELAPHTVEAAALYGVVTRLDDSDLRRGLDLVDKALLFDRGYIHEGDERLTADDVRFADDASDGLHGIPVTFTRDTIADLLASERDRSHPDLAVETVITPDDVLDAMVAGLAGAPLYSQNEQTEYEDRVAVVRAYIRDQQEADVLAALLADEQVTAAEVETYIEHVYAWATDDTIENDRGETIPPDPLQMKVFEIEALGRFGEADYDGSEPSSSVREFREERIITALNRHAWEQRGEDFAVEDIDVSAIPVIEDVLASDDWDDVRRVFPDFDPRQWDDPPANTETATCKERAITHMVSELGYTAASAELTGREVMAEVSERWD
jgi:predicted Ser/Thr protein kinase